MKPVIFFHVNKHNNPYEDLNHQNEMIDMLVECEIPFSLGAEILNRQINMGFLVSKIDFLDNYDMFEFCVEMGASYFVMIDRLGNVWQLRGDGAEERQGRLVEVSEKVVTELPWVFYAHDTQKYYTVEDN